MKWQCTVDSCSNAALEGVSSQCQYCFDRFCCQHHVSQFHECPTQDDVSAIIDAGDSKKLTDLNALQRSCEEAMISKLIHAIDAAALGIRASALRDGIPCQVYLPSAATAYCNDSVVGGRNYHAQISFEDGKQWLARFQLPNHTDPPALAEKNFNRRSEYATYVFLAQTKVPTPLVYSVADDGDDDGNHVGPGYIFMEKLAGAPADWSKANASQKETFTRQVAEIYATLARQPFDKLGRLQLSSSGKVEVGPAFFAYDAVGLAIEKGPFLSMKEYYEALLSQAIQTLELQNGHNPAQKLKALLMYEYVKSNLPSDCNGPFFLCHVDSRDANFLVDEEYNITGVIDWGFAIVIDKSAAFQSPLLMYDFTLVFGHQISDASDDEKRLMKSLCDIGSSDLAPLVADKLHFRIDQVIGADTQNMERFVESFGAWLKLVRGRDKFDEEEWLADALKSYGGKELL